MAKRADGKAFQQGDVVKVVRRPSPEHLNSSLDSLGFWGFIESFDEHKGCQYVQLHCLDGNGAGAVPLECVDHFNEPFALKAKQEHDLGVEERARQIKHKIADRLDVSPEVVEAVLDLWNRYGVDV